MPYKNPMSRLLYRISRKLNKISSGRINDVFGYNFDKDQKIIQTPQEREHEMNKIMTAIKQPMLTESEMKRVEIIVLNYKDPEIEWKNAKHIIENTDWPYKLNMYDNRPGIKNFSKTWNRLIRESTCDYVMIVDNDVFVPRLDPDWLTRMMKTFDEFNDCYVVVPRVTNTSCDEQRATQAEDRPATPMKDIFAAQMVLYKKEIFDKVGYFDEDFLFYGQDSEWALRTMRKGFKIYLRHDVLVDHIGHYSTKKEAKSVKPAFDRELEREYAGKLFEEKTGESADRA